MHSTTGTTHHTHPTRRSLRDSRRRSRRTAALGPASSAAAAAVLVAVASLANPMTASAQPVSVGTTNASTALALGTVAATADATDTTDPAAGALFERTKDRADVRAAEAVASGNAVLASVKGKVDTAPLVTSLASLANYAYLDTTTVQTLTTTAVAVTTQATTQAAAVDKAAADAAAQAAAEAAAAAQAAAEALALANTPDGARTVAAQMASDQYGWGSDQFQCLDSLWTKESGWNYQAENASSGAYGIPQSLPGSKMASIADDWATNAVTQISWGLNYISRGYGTPCSAWSHSQSVNWY
ncbi:phospholipase [Herbiconiux sp. YIM B11900]|uniref:aggregation-promoting factor C-terminal-like domain-containing protein n=1 Tax=Herbiconiux sp. YIM B11900 TaxID=3404131 RepID=UPI003F857F29